MDVEEPRLLLPPFVIRFAESVQSAAAVLGVPLHELESSLHAGQWRRRDVDAEHRPEPGVLADTLMDHLLVDASATRIVLFRPQRQVVVLELAPDAQNLQSFALI